MSTLMTTPPTTPPTTSDLDVSPVIRRRPRDAIRVLSAQVAAEVRTNLRVPEFLVGAVSVPVLLYAMFGSAQAGEALPAGTSVAAMMAVSFAAYGIVSLAIFTFGVDIARERGQGWLRTRRVTPLPTWVYFAGKIAMALAYSVVILAGITVVAVTLGDVRLPMETWIRLWAVLASGAIVFSTFGFAIAWLARPRAASTIGNLLFLPLSFASGFFFPLSELPPVLAEAAPWLPTYHYGRVVWAQLAPPVDVTAWTGAEATGSLWPHVAWMLGSFVVFGILAAVGWRRDREATLG
ncbi:ABC transporter permease [Salsipaludibacter albus]|uniref:ABC transporter permease n=1 Tax=Salsipaludibacter albus TaxID=2849650 RepID=UPI001EE40EED|nr:ABC transporter permease [Salsipaludibacter albus]